MTRLKYIYLIIYLLLNISLLSAQSVTLSGCTDTTPNVQYNFYRGVASGQESSTALNTAPVSTCSYTDNTVQPFQTYYYTAKAFCSVCNPQLSAASNEVTAVVPANPQPAPPTGLVVGTISKNNVPLQWNAPVENGLIINSYSVFRCTNANCPNPPSIANVTSTSYTDKPSKGMHYYEVKANETIAGNNVVSPASNIVSADVISLKLIDKIKNIFK